MSKGLLFWIIYVISALAITWFSMWSTLVVIAAVLMFLVGWAVFGFVVQ